MRQICITWPTNCNPSEILRQRRQRSVTGDAEFEWVHANLGDRLMEMNSSKTQQLTIRLAIALICASAAATHSSAVLADTAARNAAAADTSGELEEVIVTGTRQAGQKAADSPAPIQILSSDALQKASGNPDLMSTLAQIVPSLTMQSFGFDMAGQTLQAKLRGLSPNHVLVLVNGKRRHTTANLAVDTGSVYQGGAGVDLNFIPLDAIDHIEVLTDGAAAQYGTDAIAGVINIILKKNTSGGIASATYGQYANGGGKTEDVSGNAGFEPADGGYFSLTGQYHNHGHSNVGAIDERVINPANTALKNPDGSYNYPKSNLTNVPGYPYLNRISGDGQQQSKQLLVNTGFDFTNGTEIYSTITYAHKDAASYENYRLPNKADYTSALTGQTVYALPFGFNPQEASYENDYQLNLGIKGAIASWNWDLSSGYGGDKVSVSTIDSYNTGYAQNVGFPSPTNFYDGYLQATQWTTTADINKDFDVGFALRGTVSNGCRAPTLAEECYSAVNVGATTAFAQLAPNSPAAALLGLGNGLQPEHSVNLSLGAVWRPTPGMNATLDVYQITITNRIVGSGQIIGQKGKTTVSGPVNDAIAASGAPIDPQVLASGTTGINIFANGIDTRTRGADLVFDFPIDYAFGKVDGRSEPRTTIRLSPSMQAHL